MVRWRSTERREAEGRARDTPAGATLSDEAQVRACIERLRRRAYLVHGARVGTTALGLVAPLFLALAFLASGVVTRPAAWAAWAILVGVFAGGAYCFGRPLLRLRRGGAVRLLEPRDPSLASALRSAYELAGRAADDGTSDELRAAHVRLAAARASAVDPAVVTPWREAARPAALAGLGASLAALLLVGASERLSAGAFALLHPARTGDDGEVYSDVIRSTRATLSFPAYVGRGPVELEEADSFEAPIGTHVRYVVVPRARAERALLVTPDGEVPLARREDGAWVGEFLVRQGGRLEIRVAEDDARWLVDARRRVLRAVIDAAPTVMLHVDPLPASLDVVAFRFEAADDHGLRKIELVVEGPGGETTREALAEPEGLARKLASGSHRFALGAMNVRPGDEIRLWLEATDHDDVSGPNVGRSEVISLGLPSETSRRAEELADLQAVLNGALDALADRLELPIGPEASEPPAPERHARVDASADAAQALAKRWTVAAGEHDVVDEADRALVARFADHLGRALRAERATFRRRLTFASATEADRDVVETLEEGTLTLADVVARARIQDAAALARELERLRREMVSLLEELRRADNADARRALMAAIHRAQARMRDLQSRIAAMGTDVPSDFVNVQDLPAQATEDALEQLSAAVERGDLEEAEQHLLDFERQVEAMAEALGKGEQDFTEARFGARQRAMAEALEALRGLEVEQQKLAQGSEEVRRGAAERALDALGAGPQQVGEGLSENVDRLLGELHELARRPLGQADDEAVDRLDARLRDVSAALSQGDIGEAQRMARSAGEAAHALARDLELSALMFPGRDGRLRDAANQARQIADGARRLGADVDRAIPRFSDHLGAGDRQALAENRTRQRRASERADELAQRFEGGAEAEPLSPEVGQGLREVGRTMNAADEALAEGDAISAAEHQREAARRLRELREDLEQNRRSQSGAGGAGEGGGLEEAMRPDRRVEIPRGPAARDGQDRRRLVLDGMREGAPSGYEQAVRRYYEELLR
jgi:hypothetical protein